MKRTWGTLGALVALMLALALGLTACGGGSKESAGGASSPDAGGGSQSAETERFAAIPTDGPGESAAVKALPAALEEGKAMRETAGMEWPDITGIEPRLTAYLIAVEKADGTYALAEVWADGVAHTLYNPAVALDTKLFIWSQPDSGSPRAAARSDREKAACAAVEKAAAPSFPGETLTVKVYGYRFTYLKDGEDFPVMTLEMATDGSVISVGN